MAALTASVITCSDSVAAQRHEDESGVLAMRALQAEGFAVEDPFAVPDEGSTIGAAVRAAIAAGARVVVTNGGTGLGPRDVTIEAVEGLGAVALPGIGEAIRAGSRTHEPKTDLSRAGGYRLAKALVVCLPGSPGGVSDGMRIVGPLLRHAVAMIDGQGHGHHAPPGGGGTTVVLDPAQDGTVTIALDPTGDGNETVVLAPAATGSETVVLAPAATGSETVVLAPAGGASAAARPPAPQTSRAFVGDAPIEMSALLAEVADDRSGAVVSFEGRVRNSDHGRRVVSLAYEAHPDAARVLASLVAAAVSRPTVTAAAAAHRTGELAIGELAFAVVVSAPHRRPAIETMAWLVDEAKAALPIWKLQRFADGTTEWVNSP